MSTPKELNVQAGDAVQFKAQPHPSGEMHMFAADIGAVLHTDAQEWVWDLDLVSGGMIGRCTSVLPKQDGTTVYKFRRIRESGALGDASIPVRENDDCIESIVYGPFQFPTSITTDNER
jgi:hypothetical protein